MEKKKESKAMREEVVREYPPVGKYRVRLVQNPKKKSVPAVLDIREYVSSEKFEGFTRRGIRLADRAEMDLLRDVLKEILERNGLEKPAPGMLPLS